MEIRKSQPEELPEIISLLDNEFIYSKNRSISLQKRFPGLLVTENAQNLYVACDQAKLVSIVGVKHFRYHLGHELYKGAMIGGVFTRPSHRGKGYASKLMRHVGGELEKEGVDFVVLWTTIHQFYDQLGYSVRDTGCKTILNTAEYLGNAKDQTYDFEKAKEPTSFKAVDDLRIRASNNSWIERDLSQYSAIPIPAEATNVITISRNLVLEGYFIYGTNTSDCIYLYEAYAIKPLGGLVLSYLARTEHSKKRIFLNHTALNSFYEDSDLAWENQNLTMIKSFRREIYLDLVYIAFMDRI